MPRYCHYQSRWTNQPRTTQIIPRIRKPAPRIMAELQVNDSILILETTTAEDDGIDHGFGIPDLKSPKFMVEWIIVFIILLLNSSVFFVIPKMKTLRKTTRNGILAMAFADLTTGVDLFIGLIYTYSTRRFMHTGGIVCNIFAFFNNTSCFASIYIMTFLNLDKFLTLKYPFSYTRRMTTGASKIVLVGCWVFWAIIFAPLIPGTLGPRFSYNPHTMLCCIDWLSPNEVFHMTVVQTMGAVVPTIINSLAFVGILKIATGRRNPGEATVATKNEDAKNMNDKKTKKELKVVRTLFIMTVGIYLAWVPYIGVVGFYNYFQQKRIHHAVDFVVAWVAMSNSFWNVFVYLLTMRPYQKAFLSLIPCVTVADDKTSSSGGTASSSLDTSSKVNQTYK